MDNEKAITGAAIETAKVLGDKTKTNIEVLVTPYVEENIVCFKTDIKPQKLEDIMLGGTNIGEINTHLTIKEFIKDRGKTPTEMASEMAKMILEQAEITVTDILQQIYSATAN